MLIQLRVCSGALLIQHEKENASYKAGPTAMPPPSDGGGSLSLDY